MTKININELFNLLDDWRNLPAYQLERRADIFFGLHMEKILGEKIDVLIPEFPIRKGSLPQEFSFNKDPNERNNQSFKIDYLVFSENKNLVYFIELKTDVSSLNQKQDWYLETAKKEGMLKILDGLREIYPKSNKNGKSKYEYLFKKLNEIGWIKGLDGDFEILIKSPNIEIRYIQPTNPKNLNDRIIFDDIILALSDSKEPLTLRFIESLKKWKSNINSKN